MNPQLFPSDPVNPMMGVDVVRTVLAHDWGADGELTPLGSMQDQNYRLRRTDGTSYVVKIAGGHTAEDELDLQNAAMRHVAAHADRGFESPEPVPTLDGRDSVTVDGHIVRLLTWVHGTALFDRAYVPPRDLYALGALAARLLVALEEFEHPALHKGNVWDLRNARLVLTDIAPSLGAEWEPHMTCALDALASIGEPDLPVVVAHGDVTPVNTVTTSSGMSATPVGVLDFGDIMWTWRIGDVAAAAVGTLEQPGTGDGLDAALAVLHGYHDTVPLTEAEVDVFWPLVTARAMITASTSYRQLAGNPDNRYVQDGVESGLRAVRRIAAVRPELARAAARARTGFAAVPHRSDALEWLARQRPAPLVPGLDLRALRTVDLSSASDEYTQAQWSQPEPLQALIGDRALLRYGEARMTESIEPAGTAPATVHLGVDVVLPVGTAVALPLGGSVAVCDDEQLVVDLDAGVDGPVQLRLSGVRPDSALQVGTSATAGTTAGTLIDTRSLLPARVHVQLLLAPGLPPSGQALHRQAWQALSPDPSVLLGVPAAAEVPVEAELQRIAREHVVARPQHLYYDRPLEIVRGWKHFLFDRDARCYLDMINNIAAVGHSHPRVTEAALRQFRRLNTNSRFLYDSMTRYCERIAALLPDGLDRVFLVNSGSEAADLALQLARRTTGREDVVALAGAYHGWTGAVLDVCTSPVDRPNWRNELQPWIHIAEQPDTYRGAHGADAAPYRASVGDALRAAGARGGAAAFISEPLLGNQGALELPKGYLQGVYEDARAAGALCLADEVQVGMARTGYTFWAFEAEGVVPDIVYTAKATGNGHPLGVVACSAEVADSFDGKTAYFSSTGGGPVSCEIGLAVLDIMRDEGLQENARVVGAHLKQELALLADRHELIGAVHGRGLYQGIDLVRDRETKEPAIYEAQVVSERLRSAGVIMQPTGDAFNVLKVKPPLCLDIPGADFFVGALDDVLTNLV